MFVGLVECFLYKVVCGLQIYLMLFVGVCMPSTSVHLQINEFTKDCSTPLSQIIIVSLQYKVYLSHS
jgi:hypothetical protein